MNDFYIIFIVRLYEPTMKKINCIISDRIKELKDSRGLSWEKLAYSAGISKSGLSQVKNKQNSPTISSLLKICSALEISPKDFFDFEIDLTDFD